MHAEIEWGTFAIFPPPPAFHVDCMCAEWEGLDIHRSLFAATSSYLFITLDVSAIMAFIDFFFFVAQSELMVCAVAQFLRVAFSGVMHVFRIDDRVSLGEPLLAAFSSALIDLVDSMNIL